MNTIQKRQFFFLVIGIAGVYLLSSFIFHKKELQNSIKDNKPRIVNIINFIRLNEPRDAAITEDVLYETVVKQIELMRTNKLKGTFLLQYDALLNPRYQQLLKALPADSFEIGAWWEMPQPFVEDAGLQWRGNASWDSRADVDFATGYSPGEREKLADTYMKSFKNIFGYYPKSVGSWFIDAYSLNYLYKKYGIVASCNCKDQIGTDGYTLWGGYWNQAYYPSLKNAYMPAQHESKQIPVPVFRMLGSDAIRQYDEGVGTHRQGVVTLEPVYKFGGGDSAWVHWYFNEFVDGECLDYAYVQAGQENSFTWNAMAKGLLIQFPLIAKLRDENKLQVETLAESGKWFREKYKLTPATSVTINEDLKGSDLKTVWFDSRFYRMNLLWEGGTLRFRDIHLFDENVASAYLTKKSTSPQSSFLALPFVDGHVWSSKEKIAGLWFKAIVKNKEIVIKGGKPVIKSDERGELRISWPLESFKGTLVIEMNEHQIKIKLNGNNSIKWFLDLSTATSANLPFKKISTNKVNCKFEGTDYFITTKAGSFSQPADSIALRIAPTDDILILNLAGDN